MRARGERIRGAPGDFDPVLHSAPRLKLVLLIGATGTATFHELLRDAQLTRGNLASHLKALEAAGYIEAPHMIVELRPRRRYRLTPQGREALVAYRASLEEAIRSIARVEPAAPSGAAAPREQT